MENTHKSVYLPVIDCLFLYGDIMLEAGNKYCLDGEIKYDA